MSRRHYIDQGRERFLSGIGVPEKSDFIVDDFQGEAISLVANGMDTLVVAPTGDAPELLTDGWRNEPGHTWRSAPSPVEPIEIVYALANPVAVSTVQIHQDPERPSRAVEVSTSTDGVTYSPLVAGDIPCWAGRTTGASWRRARRGAS